MPAPPLGMRRLLERCSYATDGLASNAHPMIIAPMIESEIQIGDLVAFAEGGPAMTVQARSQNLAYCAWLVDGRLHQGTFEMDSLRVLRAAPRRREDPPQP